MTLATTTSTTTTPLLTDLYQLTMAAAYRRAGMADREAVFHLGFRRHPFGGGFTIAAGLGPIADFLRDFRFAPADLEYLASLPGAGGRPLFDDGFLAWLGELRLSCDVDAVAEGTPVFPQAPLLRVRGPLAQGQLLETPLLNLLGFQTLVATKAARVVLAAHPDPVIDFGLRRAQGPDGGLGAARAAYLGGCAGTSNVLAGQRYGIPVKGTHAHSWVMAFDSEEDAFDAYLEAMPHNATLLVDTYDSKRGIRRAVEAGRRLQERGGRLLGLRLDSGDLLALSRFARAALDEAGMADAVVAASGDLDEHAIRLLRAAGAPIGLWGVGTRLVTAHDDPALGCVYKLSAIRDGASRWRHRLKISDEPAKSSLPGIPQVRRLLDADGTPRIDVVWDELLGWSGHAETADGVPVEIGGLDVEGDLLVPVARAGRVLDPDPLPVARDRCRRLLARLDPAHRTLERPASYLVGLDRRLLELQRELASELAASPP